MTPPTLTAPARTSVQVWVLNHVAHRLHGGMSVGCWEPITDQGTYLPVDEADRHGFRPCYRAGCFPNGYGR